MNHTSCATDCTSHDGLVGIFLTLDLQVRIKRNRAEPVVAVVDRKRSLDCAFPTCGRLPVAFRDDRALVVLSVASLCESDTLWDVERDKCSPTAVPEPVEGLFLIICILLAYSYFDLRSKVLSLENIKKYYFSILLAYSYP
jgi:hypothetical protein